jgi:hemoglobin-like flavoprotein
MEFTKLSGNEIILIQSSFQKLLEQTNNFGKIFYDKLFKINPGLEKLFKGDMKEQERKLIRMVKVVVDGLNNPHIIFPAIQELGIKHFEFGVAPKDYKIFGDCLVESLESNLGEIFDKKTKDAWYKLYDELTDIMQGNQYK